MHIETTPTIVRAAMADYLRGGGQSSIFVALMDAAIMARDDASPQVARLHTATADIAAILRDLLRVAEERAYAESETQPNDKRNEYFNLRLAGHVTLLAQAISRIVL